MNWEGTDGQTIEEFLSEWHAASADRSYVPSSGDSSHQAAARFIAALDEFAATGADDGEVVVVAHGGVTVDALRTLLGDHALLAPRTSLIEDGVPSCAITTLRRGYDRWQMEPPSTSHLHA